MKTTMKSLAVAALTVIGGFIAVPAVQAQDNIFIEEQNFVQINDGFYDDDQGFRPRHIRRHHQNGFSFELQFGQPDYYQPRHPRVIYQPRVIHRPQPVIRLTQSHVQWCYDRYRTYDHRSNSFVIRHGQRAYCVSPFSY